MRTYTNKHAHMYVYAYLFGYVCTQQEQVCCVYGCMPLCLQVCMLVDMEESFTHASVAQFGNEGAAGGRTDVLLALMKGGRWSVLQLLVVNGAIHFRPPLVYVDASQTPRPAHGALRLDPGPVRLSLTALPS